MTSLVRRSSAVPSRDEFFNLVSNPFESAFDRYFDDFLPDFMKELPTLLRKGGNHPKMDALVDGDKFKVQVACPGVKEEDLKVEIAPGDDAVVWLTITGKMSDEYEHKDKRFVVKELAKSTFKRSMLLPTDIEGDPVANLKDGMLTLTWKLKAKTLPERVSKQIPINNSG